MKHYFFVSLILFHHMIYNNVGIEKNKKIEMQHLMYRYAKIGQR